MRDHRLHRAAAGRAAHHRGAAEAGVPRIRLRRDRRGVRRASLGIRRSAGKLANLETALATDPLSGDFGLGHTRWATHGRPTEENAHPHRDCNGRIVVVHNGIIENYLELKRELQSQGHRFVTETDTEVVAHLVEREWRSDGLDGAVRRAMARLKGLFALVMLSADDPFKIVAVRNGPPVVVGLGDGEYFVASDIPAILAHTRNVVFLGDQEMAVVTRQGAVFSDFDGDTIAKTPTRVTWDPIAAEKSGFKHFMLKEIFEQPAAVRDTVLGRVSLETGTIFPDETGLDDATLRAVERVTLIACGTSWHAALVGKFLIEELARIPVEVDYGSEYRYRRPLADASTLAVAITQSGETADTLAALREARRQGARSLAVCNVVGSMATRESEGTSTPMPARKSASPRPRPSPPSWWRCTCWRCTWRRPAARSRPSARKVHIADLLQLPQQIEHVLKCAPQIEDIASRFHSRSDFLYLGRGINYPIALEGALKLKEVSYIHAEGYPAGEMKHGPIALIDEQMPVVAIAPHDHVFDKMQGNIQEVKARGGSVIALTTAGDDALWRLLDPATDSIIAVPAMSPHLAPIVITVPLQLLAYHIAVRRGCDVDQPRNLAKSVTVE